MGRTVPTFTTYLQEEINSWSTYRRALSKEDKEAFDKMLRYAKYHLAEASSSTRPIPFDAVVMNILLEQQKEIDRLAYAIRTQPGTSLQRIPILRKVG